MTEISRAFVNNDPEKPVRLNKYLSDAGFCSRREADRLTEQGKVCVDGVLAVMGQKVLPGQEVSVEGIPVKPHDRLILLAFNKPCGIECTTDPGTKDNIVDYIGYPERIYPIGRLDKPSTGLILLTNTGELVNAILKGSNFHEKEYVVTVDRPFDESFIRNMAAGVVLDDGIKTRPCRIEREGSKGFRIILTQGLNRQIRRMCRALGYYVETLKRVRVMNIKLGDLPEGKYRDVSAQETEELIKLLGI